MRIYDHIFPKVTLTETCIVYSFAQKVISVWLHLKHLKITITTLLKDIQNGFKQKKTRTSMDSVRNKFVNKMKKSSITNILSEPAENLVNQN